MTVQGLNFTSRVPGCLQVRSEDKIVFERQNALGVFTGGRNDVEAASQGILLLEQPGMVRFDDGEVHEVVVHYTAGQGQLDIYLDRSRERRTGQPTLTVHHSCQELAPQKLVAARCVCVCGEGGRAAANQLPCYKPLRLARAQGLRAIAKRF